MQAPIRILTGLAGQDGKGPPDRHRCNLTRRKPTLPARLRTAVAIGVRPGAADCCNSINVKRTTIEEIGLFLAGLAHYDLRLCESVEVYELTEPALVMQLRDEAGRLIVEN